MAVTITDQRTIVNECDATTGWTGSNTVTLYTADPAPVEATGCLGMVVSNTTHNAYYTISSTDIQNNLIYAWIFHRAQLDTKANGGVMIQLGDGTNRIGFHVAGSDYDGFRHSEGPVGWQCVVIDTGNLPASSTVFAGSLGSLNLAAITQIGVAFKTTVKAVGGVDNCFWDVLRRGTAGQGLMVTGGTSGDPGTWEQIATADRAVTNQAAYGIVRKLGEGVYGVQGPITFGGSGAENTYFKDTGATVVFEERGLAASRYSITTQEGSGSTEFYMGTATGAGTTLNGINGCTIIMPASATGAVFTATDVDITDVGLYNCRLVGFGGGVSFSSDATTGPNHEVAGTTFRKCGQVVAGRVVMRNNLFTESVTEAGAMLWNENINISNCSFTNNTQGTNGSGVEHPSAAGTPYSYTAMKFSGNDKDVNNSSGSAITINADPNSNPGTYTGSTVTFVNTVTLTITCLNEAGLAVPGVRTRIETDPAGTLITEGTTNGSGVFTDSYNYTGDQAVKVIVRLKGYKNNQALGMITGAFSQGFTMLRDQAVDLP